VAMPAEPVETVFSCASAKASAALRPAYSDWCRDVISGSVSMSRMGMTEATSWEVPRVSSVAVNPSSSSRTLSLIRSRSERRDDQYVNADQGVTPPRKRRRSGQ
jgi:hypothetical protein